MQVIFQLVEEILAHSKALVISQMAVVLSLLQTVLS